MTNLTEELQRLNELDAKRTQGEVKPEWYADGEEIYVIGDEVNYALAVFEGLSKDDAAFIAAAPDAIALANKLHGLLVQAEAALAYVPGDWGASDIARAKAAETLTALHAAGIGRE